MKYPSPHLGQRYHNGTRVRGNFEEKGMPHTLTTLDGGLYQETLV